mmetsp:Transcript_43402/g.82788  ORF Transcript_43402/g.82788 Transcript_43402/m.82788 type:complete len:1135 (-) Transcript_43402:160-3564(-)
MDAGIQSVEHVLDQATRIRKEAEVVRKEKEEEARVKRSRIQELKNSAGRILQTPPSAKQTVDEGNEDDAISAGKLSEASQHTLPNQEIPRAIDQKGISDSGAEDAVEPVDVSDAAHNAIPNSTVTPGVVAARTYVHPALRVPLESETSEPQVPRHETEDPPASALEVGLELELELQVEVELQVVEDARGGELVQVLLNGKRGVTSESDVSTKVKGELGLDTGEMCSLEVDNAVGIQIVSPEVSRLGSASNAEYMLPDMRVALKRRMDRRVSNVHRSKSLVAFHHADLNFLGMGIVLYFKTMTSLMKLFIFLFVLNLFTVVCCFLAALDSNVLLSSVKGHKITTLMSIILHDEADMTAGTDDANCCPVEGANLFSSKTVLLIVGILDALSILVYSGWTMVIRRKARKWTEAADKNLNTIGDFSIWVKDLPADAAKDFNDTGKIKAFFEELAGPVYDVVILSNVGEVFPAQRMKFEKLVELERLKSKLEKKTPKEERSSTSFAKSGAGLEKHAKVQALECEVEKLRHEVEEATIVVQNIQERLYFTCCSALVTFDSQQHAQKMVDAYSGLALLRKRKFHFGGTKILRVSRAPEADDCQWEHMHLTRWRLVLYRTLTALGMVLILLASVVCAALIAKEIAQRTVDVSCLLTSMQSEGSSLDQVLDCGALWDLDSTNSNQDFSRESNQIFRADLLDKKKCGKLSTFGIFQGNVSVLYDYTLEEITAQESNEDLDIIPDWPVSEDKECAAQVCYQCYCMEQGFSDYFAGVKDLDSFCQDYWSDMVYAGGLQALWISVLTLTDYVLLSTVRYLSSIEGHKTTSGEEASIAIKTCAALLVEYGALPLVVQANIKSLSWIPFIFKGEYKDFSAAWYDKVGDTILLTTAVHVVAWPLRWPIMYLIQCANVWMFWKRAVTQHELNLLLEPPTFSLAERTGQLMCAMILGLLFSTGMPLMLLLTAMYMCFQTISDRYMLLMVCACPPKYDETMHKLVLQALPVAAILHLLFGIWMLGYDMLDSWRLGADLTDNAHTQRVFNLGARLKLANTLPLTMVLAIVLMAEIVFSILRRCCGSCKGKGVGGGDEFEETFTVACEQKLLQGAKTYHIQSQVRYENTIPTQPKVNANEADHWWTLMIGDAGIR